MSRWAAISAVARSPCSSVSLVPGSEAFVPAQERKPRKTTSQTRAYDGLTMANAVTSVSAGHGLISSLAGVEPAAPQRAASLQLASGVVVEQGNGASLAPPVSGGLPGGACW